MFIFSQVTRLAALILICCLCLPVISISQGEVSNLYFKHISSEDGLSHNSISSILQDRDGVMWIGTFDGLNRYDGRSIQVFQHDETDSTSLSNSTIWDIIESEDGDLWMTTYKGLNRYSKKTGKFERYLSGGIENRLDQLEEDQRGNIWLAARGAGLLRLSWPTHDVRRSSHNYEVTSYTTQDGLLDNNIAALFIQPTSPHILWVGSASGIVRMDLREETFTEVKLSEYIPSLSGNVSIERIYQDNEGIMWFGSINDGLFSYDLVHDQIKQYLYNPNDESTISGNRVSDIGQDATGEIWTASYSNGISLFNKKEESFTRIQAGASIKNGISTNNTSRILCTPDDNIWIGTSGKGLSLYAQKKFRFAHLSTDNTEGYALSSQNISSIYKDHLGDVWVGTHGTGINKIRLSDDLAEIERISYFKKNDGSHLRANRIATIHELDSNLVVIGYIGAGASVYNRRKAKFQDHLFELGDLDGLFNKSVYFITQDQNDQIWIGARDGLYRYDQENKQVILESGHNNTLAELTVSGCNSIIEDSSANLWIATAINGVIKYDPNQKKVLQHITAGPKSSGLKSNAIITMLADQKNIIWLGTWGGGMSKLNTTNSEIKTYGRNNGLANEAVYSIVQSASNELWLSTNKGISSFNTQSEIFSNYFLEDGLQGEEYNSRSGFLDKKENIVYFGGVNGLNAFRTNDAIAELGSIDLYISELVRYRTVDSKTSTYLEADLKNKRSINLNHRDHTLVFRIAVINYLAPEKLELRYQLEGVSKSWISIGKNSEIRLANINPGSYTLKVQVYNGGVPLPQPLTSLKINVHPPWWQTWPAYFGYALAILAGFYLFYNYRIYQLKKYQDLRIKISSDLHDDVGSLLSGVAMQSEMMAVTMPEQKKQGMSEISDLSRDALDRMRDIVWAIDSRKDKYENLIDRMRSFTESQLSKKGISHTFKVTGITGKSSIDPGSRQNIYLILKEAITNIIKHSDASFVEINFSKSGKNLILSIADNGTIKKERPSDGLGLSNMRLRAKDLGGELIIDQSNGYKLELSI